MIIGFGERQRYRCLLVQLQNTVDTLWEQQAGCDDPHEQAVVDAEIARLERLMASIEPKAWVGEG